ncbi:hypothetical protein PENCOP_c001G05339 [Penicillium coprophilum]|uniref:Uncharacterized protein n=1 Tax=Penicillium coprophilum TaxID=36646 RepID=A0A1V6V6B9_9EURO|nr:hypothetical protein PENCOP_c001G05339 [Penicillium coprophilum]
MSSKSGDFPLEETEREHLQRLRQLEIQPWFSRVRYDATSMPANEIPHRWPWGYTIYRIVYTPEPDLYWEAAVDAIRANILATLDWQQHNNRRQDEQGGLVFEDKIRLDKATIARVREDFKASVDNEVGALGNRFRWFLVIDEEALQSFIHYSKALPIHLQERAYPTERGVGPG